MRVRDLEQKKATTVPKHSGFRALRSARRKAYYAARPSFTLESKRRTLGRQLRRFPEDKQARALYIARYGEKSLAGHLASACGRARRRAARNGRPHAMDL